MSNEKWSEWIDWGGGDNCPVDGDVVMVRSRDGSEGKCTPWAMRWSHISKGDDIIAYRYRIEEPTKAVEGMHPDLWWLAENVIEWNDHPEYIIGDTSDLRIYRRGNKAIYCSPGSMSFRAEETFTHHEWLQARKDLGLDTTYATPEQEADWHKEEGLEAWAESVPEGVIKYSPYFKDVRHIDTLDVYRVVDLFGCEKHGHPISHAAKKLLLSGVRTGGKDVEKDVDEAIDSLIRWKEMREEDRRATS